MPNLFHLQIISPTARRGWGDIESLIAPGEEGYLGVLANHAPLLTPLREGDLTVRTGRRQALDEGLERWISRSDPQWRAGVGERNRRGDGVGQQDLNRDRVIQIAAVPLIQLAL